MKRELRLQAREMRKQGLPLNDIVAALGVAKSSVSYWVRDIVLTESQLQQIKEQKKDRLAVAHQRGANTNREKFRKLRLSYQMEGRAKAREGRPLHLMGCMLFWAEGSKDKSELIFVNSDSAMLITYVRFLREEMNVPDDDITIRIFCHTTDESEITRMQQYWLNLFKLPETATRKTVFKKGSKIIHNSTLNGICRIRVKNSVRLTQHIYGAIQEYTGIDNPNWLF